MEYILWTCTVNLKVSVHASRPHLILEVLYFDRILNTLHFRSYRYQLIIFLNNISAVGFIAEYCKLLQIRSCGLNFPTHPKFQLRQFRHIEQSVVGKFSTRVALLEKHY